MLAMNIYLDDVKPSTVVARISLWCKCVSGSQKLRQWWFSCFFSHSLAMAAPFFLLMTWMMVSSIGWGI